MPILEKARELAELISESPELSAVRAAEEEMANNDGAHALIEQFQKKQAELQQAYMNGQEMTEAQRQEMEALNKQLHDNPFIAKYFAAQDNFQQILNSVNFIITKAISGEEPDACGCGGGSSDGCGSGCSSCG